MRLTLTPAMATAIIINGALSTAAFMSTHPSHPNYKPSTFMHKKHTSSSTMTTFLQSSKTSSPPSPTSAPTQPQRRPRPPYHPSQISDPDYVRIFDTTLRDGEQSPGATLTSNEKLEIARNLARLGVDIIEAGFPIASPDDFKAVRQIANIVGNEVFDDGYVPVICGLSRANEKDIQTAWDAVKGAKLPRVHTFIATSPIHMETKLRKTPDEVVEIAVGAVKFARSLGCVDVEFSPEDAGRSEPEFLYRILAEVIKVGATTLNIPDTTGWNMPWEFGDLIKDLRENVEGAENVIFSTHCQNDLGLSTANSLAGALNGARQLECTINGIGERAGNASLEEICMSLALKGDTHFKGGPGTGRLYTSLNPVYITATSKMVSEYTGMACQPHKAIVGVNAFKHESGIHQDGMIKNKSTYEIMTPESIGLMRGDSQSGVGLVLGKHSGRNAVGTRLRELGYELDDKKFSAVFQRFKEVAEKRKGGLEDDDLEALVSDQSGMVNRLWEVTGLQVSTGMSGMPTATVKMMGPDGVERYVAQTGTGPVDAVYKAIDTITGVRVNLESYTMNSVTEGIEALATTRVVIAPASKTGLNEICKERKFTGLGSELDIVTSSARAYTSALNKLLTYTMKRQSKSRSGGIGDAVPVDTVVPIVVD